MPIHDVGYRAWVGTRMPRIHAFLVMVLSGIMITRRSAWIRRMLAASWLPVVYIGAGFYFIEQTLQTADPSARRMFVDLFGRFFSVPNTDALQQGLMSAELDRHRIWAGLIAIFLSYPQSVASLVLTGLIAPPLISRDLRTRAYLIYFSKPIGKWDYIGGKLATIGAFLAFITLLPALSLYLCGVGLSPDLSVIYSTWDLPFRIVVASLVFILPTSAIALMFSSLTHESRYASLAWFTFWILGYSGWSVIRAALVSAEIQMASAGAQPGGSGMRWEEVFAKVNQSNWSLLSLYDSMTRIQAWVLGVTPTVPTAQLVLIIGLTVFSLMVLSRRVTAPIRI